jgi:hypothetical protein
MKFMRLLIVALSALLLVGCNQQQMLEKFSTPADQALAKAYIADLRASKFDVIEANLDPSIKAPGAKDALVHMAGLLPAGPPTSVKMVGAQKLFSPAGEQTNTTVEYQWGDRWALCNVAIQKSSTGQTIVGINVYPQKTSLEEKVRFTLTGKSRAQYVVLAAAILALGLTLIALVACIRTKGLRRKWLWILFIIFGFGLLSTNWLTGAVNYQLLYVSSFSAGAVAPLYGPWTISASVPVGAILFLLRRRKLRPGHASTAQVG